MDEREVDLRSANAVEDLHHLAAWQTEHIINPRFCKGANQLISDRSLRRHSPCTASNAA